MAPLEKLLKLQGVDKAYFQFIPQHIVIHVIAKEHGDVDHGELLKLEDELAAYNKCNVEIKVRAHQGRDIEIPNAARILPPIYLPEYRHSKLTNVVFFCFDDFVIVSWIVYFKKGIINYVRRK